MDNVAARPGSYRVYAPNGEMTQLINAKIAGVEWPRRDTRIFREKIDPPPPHAKHQLNIKT